MRTPLAEVFMVFVLAAAAATGCSKEQSARAPINPPAPDGPPRSHGAPDWDRALRYKLRQEPGKSSIILDVQIAPGFHAYTVGETIGRPMRLEITNDSDYALSGEVIYPRGEIKDLPIGRSAFVQGDVAIAANLTKRAVDGKTARGKFEFQVCTSDACDRPRVEPFSIELR